MAFEGILFAKHAISIEILSMRNHRRFAIKQASTSQSRLEFKQTPVWIRR